MIEALFGLSYVAFVGCAMMLWEDKNKNLPVKGTYLTMALIPIVNMCLVVYMAFVLLFKEKEK